MGRTHAFDDTKKRYTLYCLAHYRPWRSRLEWLRNKLASMPQNNRLLPSKYIQRIHTLLCTCEKSQNSSSGKIWANVSSAELQNSVEHVWGFIKQHKHDPNVPFLKKFLDMLTKSCLLGSPVEKHPDYLKSSALRLVYLLQKSFKKDYDIFKPPPRDTLQSEPRSLPQSISFFLEKFDHNYLGSLIGRNGENLKKMLNKYHCHIRYDKIKVNDRFIVKATVTRKTSSLNRLEKIKVAVMQNADDVQMTEDTYASRRGELIMEDDTNFPALSLLLSSEETSLKVPIVSTENQPILSFLDTSNSFQNLQNQTFQSAGPDSSLTTSSQSGVLSSRQASSKYISSNIMSKQNDNRSIDCIVHNRRWVSTFQFFVARCPTEYLPPNKRQRFCESVCTCSEKNIVTSQKVEPQMRVKFDEVRHHLMETSYWSPETRMITKSLTVQLEKPEVWKSVHKFGDYYNRLIHKDKSFLSEMLQKDTCDPTIGEGKKEDKSSNIDTATGSSSSYQPVASISGQISRPVPQASGAASAAVPGKKKKKPAHIWNDDCFYHGNTRRGMFQCVVNQLQKNNDFPSNLTKALSNAVCICNGSTDISKLYPNKSDCVGDCKKVVEIINKWKAPVKTSLQPLLKQLDAIISNPDLVTDGYIRLVHNFKQVTDRKLTYFQDLRDGMRNRD